MKYVHEKTLAYKAGILTALLYNAYGSTRKDLPSVVTCMRDFNILPTCLGKYYTLLSQRNKAQSFIIQYESILSNPDLYKDYLGTYTDFMLGYSKFIRKKKVL